MLKTWGIIWEASDRPDGQELGGGAVGGQGGLQEVKSLQNNSEQLLKLVSNDSPYQKTLVLSPEPCL